MLGVGSYTKTYIELCAGAVESQLADYRSLSAATKGGAAEAALAAFEPDYLKTMVVALDHMFMHRLRGKEGKDGNPLNEVRMLTNAILEHGGVMKPDSTIKYAGSKSVTGIEIGQSIVLTVDGFERLAAAYFAEMEKRFL